MLLYLASHCNPSFDKIIRNIYEDYRTRLATVCLRFRSGSDGLAPQFVFPTRNWNREHKPGIHSSYATPRSTPHKDTTMTDALHRRDFLKLGSGAVAAAALGTTVSAADEPTKKRKLHKAMMYATLTYKGSVLEKFQALKAAGFEGVEPMSHMN